ncbi:cytochrome C [Meridianimarinicoccus roseus]|jgi:cytochrome c553|uniref:Cytochrome C n=1 Tax=Meridianimarinicoccus roseus TaxID=2072018 RepID=A0A2V2LGR9_9RHOB|nr:c-type cytochrome [Meridianimarinicoccus roseus]PWR04685.1 cytochrome C [Meridianimarinicoccus roseus]
MRRALTLALGGLMLAGAAPAQDLAEGRKVAGMCRTCHGLDGYAKVPIAPHIGGEPQSYLVEQLTAFKTGRREHEMMTVVASGLSPQQIVDVAAWYSAHSASASLPAGADPAAAPEMCVSCHGADGISELETAPNLAAETNIYIDTQLKAFRSGKREHEIMSAIAADLTDAEIRAYADWYAASTLTITPPPDQ